MRKSGLNMEQVKISNRANILKYVNDVGASSRKDMAQAIGLTPAALTQICTSLIEDGILVETGTLDNPIGLAGRRKVLLEINYSHSFFAAVAIEIEETTVAISDMQGNVLAKEVIPTDKKISAEDFLRNIAFVLDTLVKNSKKDVKMLCVTVPGIVETEKAVSVHSYGIWDHPVEVGKILHDQTGLEILLENNVNAFSLAEVLFGIGKEFDNFLLLKWGPGVGSSIVINREVYQGRHGKTAEIGHSIVNPNGKKCSCGKNGCLETVISYHSILEFLKFDQDNFASALKNADEKTKQNIEDIFSTFAVTIVNCMALLAPNRVVLCGRLFKDEYIRRKVINRCMELDKNISAERILYTSLSTSEGVIGPAAMFIQKTLFS